ncbi:aminotransferase A [Bacillus shivajii]|uniref:aminotransferase A n=1 Tax=Bacillus shivajii TaxID=1983719 RepID=UPI001CF999B0|nr:aminotransferase A [Bacillus shivajii]UCZ54906.1 aminotransferase A [Bacillus shivajii]
MNHLINQQVKSIEISGIRQFFNRVSEYPNALQLTLGQPDFKTPKHIKDAAKTAIDANATTYTKNAGSDEVREAAAQFLKEKYNLSYHPQSEVITTIGASQAIDITMRTILEPGSEVIIPAPVYPAYAPIVKLCGATPVFVDTRDTDFIITPEKIEEHKTENTRAVFLPYPSNPTGAVLTKEIGQKLANYLKKEELLIVSDEIYSELNYGQEHVSIAQFDGMREKTIVINGVSKSHSMTGWRIGFAFGPEPIMKEMIKVHQYNVSCASSISQAAAVQALTVGKDDADEMKEVYAKRRDFLVNRLLEIGVETVNPTGAFYVFPNIEKANLSSFDFALRLLEEEQLAVVPGDAFSQYGEGYVRLSYAYSMEQLEEAMNRFEKFWKKMTT